MRRFFRRHFVTRIPMFLHVERHEVFLFLPLRFFSALFKRDEITNQPSVFGKDMRSR